MDGKRKAFPLLLCAAFFLAILLNGCSLSDTWEGVKDTAGLIRDVITYDGSEEVSVPLPAPVQPPEIPSDPWARFEVGSGRVGAGDGYYESDIETIDESGPEGAVTEPHEEAEPGANFTFSEESNYCFAQLNSEEKKVYKEIFNCFLQMGENAELSTLDTETADKCFNFVMLDHPEIFYVEGYKISLTKRGDVPVRLGITGKYIMDAAERREKQAQIEAKVNSIIASMPADADEYTRVKYAYDYIVSHTLYDGSAEYNQNIVSVFLNGRSVCQGYSMALKYLLDRMGIMCTIVYGKAQGENHSWNMVRMDGVECFVDATWGDASYLDGPEAEEEDKINYNYFGANDELLLRTHQISTPALIPECKSLDEYYYVKEGTYFTSADMDKFKGCYDRAKEAGEAYITIKCSDKKVFNEMVRLLFDEHRIFEILDGEKKADYIRDNTEFTLTFTLQKEETLSSQI